VCFVRQFKIPELTNMYFLFLLCISKISGIMGGVNDLTLYPVDNIYNTKQLFTGLAYRLEHPTNPGLVLAWIENERNFKFANSDNSGNTSTFFLVHSGYGYQLLRNSVIKEKDIVIQCGEANGDIICYITDGTWKPEMPFPNPYPIYSAYLPLQGTAESIYQLDNP
jgi:hypothetical protein